MQNIINVDVTNYLKNKADGTARFILVEGKLHFIQKQFDPRTGAPTPQFIAMDRAELQKGRDAMAADLAGMDAMLADADKAQSV